MRINMDRKSQRTTVGQEIHSLFPKQETFFSWYFLKILGYKTVLGYFSTRDVLAMDAFGCYQTYPLVHIAICSVSVSTSAKLSSYVCVLWMAPLILINRILIAFLHSLVSVKMVT
ncbi:hypothetical protein SFRURICE_011940 [Spodoptera frugiperda]|nr:hypothetical protein SFRURICE_011940 [Spodoptera frugiperda]